MDLAQELKNPQGLSDKKEYKGIVVDNNDPEQLGRIRARIDEFFNGYEDSMLPWAIPDWYHPDGASSSSGMCVIPKIGSAVKITFQEGKKTHPIYGGYHVDRTTVIEEAKYNYPNRAVLAKFQNGAIAVLDTKDNIMFLRDPGDLRICIVGNVNLEVYGNVDEVFHGDIHRLIEGSLHETVSGSRVVSVNGSSSEKVGGTKQVSASSYLVSASSINQHSSGSSSYGAGGDMSLDGAMLYENSGLGAGDPGSAPSAIAPSLSDWPGFPGGPKGK
jgi:hypothetical protein